MAVTLKHYFRQIFSVIVICVLTVFCLSYLVFNDLSAVIGFIDLRGSLGALSLACLMAMFMPEGPSKTSLWGKFVWGLSLSHFFIFIVCIIAVISFSENLDALGPIVAYSICGYIFSLFLLLACSTYLTIAEKCKPTFLERHVAIACLGGVLSATFYPLLLFYFLDTSNNSLLLAPFALAKSLTFDLSNILSNLFKSVAATVLYVLGIYLTNHSCAKASLGNLLLVLMLITTVATNLSVISSITEAKTLFEFLSFSLENSVLLVSTYTLCVFFLMCPRISFAKINFRNVVIFGFGSLSLCLLSIYSFASVVPSSALILPLTIVIGIAVFLRYVNKLENQINERTKEISEERDKTDRLLANVLPRYVIEDLKLKGTSEPREIEGIAVMFTDFVGFTEISKKIAAKELISELNDIFSTFDKITARHSSERIKTIGDAYMCVSGLDASVLPPQQNIINIGIEILSYLHERNLAAKIKWHVRIGISSGMAVGGIVGTTKYLYDLFGDTVNTAARMESSSEPQKINVDENTYILSKKSFKFIKRKPKWVKGKGELQMYFVEL